MKSEVDYVFPEPVGSRLHLTYREWHAFVNGFYRGFTAYKGRDPDANGPEKHYWRAGFVAGWLLKIAVLLYAVPRLLP